MRANTIRLSAQRGFNLIELMVAVTISSLILIAVLRLFLDVSRTNDELAKTNAVIENGRFAIQLLQRDLMHTGFWDGYIPPYDDPIATTPGAPPEDDDLPELCAAYTGWTPAYKDALLAVPVQISDAMPSGCSGDVSSNSDVLVTRHASTCAVGSTGCAAEVSGEPYIQVSRCMGEAPFIMGQAGSTVFSLHKSGCDVSPTSALADKRRVVSHIYYIDSATPTLMRASLGASGFGTPQAMIDGVEAMRIELGIDNYNANTGKAVDYTIGERGDGVPDEYLHCGVGCSAEQLSNAVGAQIYVLVRSNRASPGYIEEKTYHLGDLQLGPFNDGFKRHLFSTNVRFHNISGRREVPPGVAQGELPADSESGEGEPL